MKTLFASILALSAATATATTFRNPFVPAQCGWTGGCYVTAYFDLNRANGVVRDWTCGTHTYDNHTGIDMGIGGFAAMNQGRDVVAAADGVVIGVHDGEFDQCTSGACGAANYVWIKHADGKVSLYYHLRKNSVVVAVGQTVTCGQKIAQVGSSGYSTGPHVHFQVNTAQGDSNSYDDPFAATNANCGGQISYWVSQGGYKSMPSYACEPKPLPDAVVTAVTTSPADPVEGQTVQLKATVKNAGNAGTGAIVGVSFTVGGVNVGFATTPAMAAGATVTLTSNSTWKALKGSHVVEAHVDDVDRFAESNEANNTKTAAVQVAALPELAVSAVRFDPAEPVEGQGVRITAVVANNGGALSGPAQVAFEINGGKIATEAVTPGATPAEVTVEWTATKGDAAWRVVVDPDQQIDESDEANNAKSGTIAALANDKDGDGVTAELDCDDGASLVHPGAAEVCNGVDDDCSGAADDGLNCARPAEAGGEAPTENAEELPEAAGGFGCSSAAAGPYALLLLVALMRRRRTA